MSTRTTAIDQSAVQLPLLAGKVAVVTGASRGIGAAAARAFADAGAAVALAAREADALEQVAHQLEERGARAIAVPTDVCDEEAVIRLIETTVGAFGRLDAAFNNAGGGGRGKAPLAALGTEEFDSVLGVNLRGAFLSMKHEIPAMLESGGGAIVNTSSTAGLAGAAAGIAPYVTAKHGLQGLTKIAALDYGGGDPRQRGRAGADPHRPPRRAGGGATGDGRPGGADAPPRPAGGGRRRRGLAVLGRGGLHHRRDARHRRRKARRRRLKATIERNRP